MTFYRNPLLIALVLIVKCLGAHHMLKTHSGVRLPKVCPLLETVLTSPSRATGIQGRNRFPIGFQIHLPRYGDAFRPVPQRPNAVLQGLAVIHGLWRGLVSVVNNHRRKRCSQHLVYESASGPQEGRAHSEELVATNSPQSLSILVLNRPPGSIMFAVQGDTKQFSNERPQSITY